ncbi:hypothetical protein QZH45_04760 [Pseudomonas corrugata]|uniref:hypothetical protein n=1 Tax=Pseudomonas corrugata TaxID=47879 RepID=UPI00083D4699|nr:hypothetical protein [Pseudomonas corrugata]AOE63769.1 hypothetical protein AXG94_19065 [Pseudomonas corrugata]
MKTSLSITSLVAVEGELLADVSVSAEQMARMNEARAMFGELRSILLAQIVPALDGGWDHPLATEIERRLESITFATRNFFWKSRHAGASHDAVHLRSCQ